MCRHLITDFLMSLFISELSGNTRELKFEVIDKSRPTGGKKLHKTTHLKFNSGYVRLFSLLLLLLRLRERKRNRKQWFYTLYLYLSDTDCLLTLSYFNNHLYTQKISWARRRCTLMTLREMPAVDRSSPYRVLLMMAPWPAAPSLWRWVLFDVVYFYMFSRVDEHVQNQLKKSWSLEQFRTLGRQPIVCNKRLGILFCMLTCSAVYSYLQIVYICYHEHVINAYI